jgi:hypothetical protein
MPRQSERAPLAVLAVEVGMKIIVAKCRQDNPLIGSTALAAEFIAMAGPDWRLGRTNKSLAFKAGVLAFLLASFVLVAVGDLRRRTAQEELVEQVKLNARQQILVEARVIAGMRRGAITKEKLFRKVRANRENGGKIKVSHSEFDRILSELSERRLIFCARRDRNDAKTEYQLSAL